MCTEDGKSIFDPHYGVFFLGCLTSFTIEIHQSFSMAKDFKKGKKFFVVNSTPPVQTVYFL